MHLGVERETGWEVQASTNSLSLLLVESPKKRGAVNNQRLLLYYIKFKISAQFMLLSSSPPVEDSEWHPGKSRFKRWRSIYSICPSSPHCLSFSASTHVARQTLAFTNPLCRAVMTSAKWHLNSSCTQQQAECVFLNIRSLSPRRHIFTFSLLRLLPMCKHARIIIHKVKSCYCYTYNGTWGPFSPSCLKSLLTIEPHRDSENDPFPWNENLNFFFSFYL